MRGGVSGWYTSIRPKLLLCQPVPKPLFGLNPRTLFGKTWWDKQRKQAYSKHDHRCWACGYRAKKISAHEVYLYDFRKGIGVFVETVALCHLCHNFIHKGHWRTLYKQEKILEETYHRVINRGVAILMHEGLIKEHENMETYDNLQGAVARWENWKLLVNGQEYKPLWKTEVEWNEYHKAQINKEAAEDLNGQS